jgi:hypothetical protein
MQQTVRYGRCTQAFSLNYQLFTNLVSFVSITKISQFIYLDDYTVVGMCIERILRGMPLYQDAITPVYSLGFARRVLYSLVTDGATITLVNLFQSIPTPLISFAE